MIVRFDPEVLIAVEYEPPSTCHFGIVTGALVAGLSELGITGGLATGIAGGLEGAGVGAALSGITGGNPLTGALTGGLTGGAIGAFGPAIGSATGLGTTAGDVIAGGAAGLAGSALTGGNLITGGLTGAAGGLASGVLSGTGGGTSAPSTTVTPAATSSGATSAAASAPSSIAAPITGPASDLASGAGISPAPGGTGGVTPVSDSFGLSSPTLAGNLLASPDFGPPATQTTTPGIGSGSGSGLSSIFGKLTSNPGVLLAGGALGADLLMGNKPLPAEQTLNQLAGEQAGVGRALSSYIFSGTLPPGAQEAVRNATNAATAKVKSTYASLGLGGSTSEAQAVSQIQSAAAAQTFLMADQLLQQGANYSALSDKLYADLLSTQLSEQNQLTSAIGTFAAGLAGIGMKSASA